MSKKLFAGTFLPHNRDSHERNQAWVEGTEIWDIMVEMPL